MVNTKKFSEFSVEQLDDGDAEVVGLETGINIKSTRFLHWTTATRPATPFNGLLGINTDLQQYEYWNALALVWTQLSSTTSGTVTSLSAGNGIVLSPDPIVNVGVISLDTPVTMANGGTGAALVASIGDIVYSGASTLALLANPGTAGKVLQSGALAAPTWSTPTYPSTSGALGRIIISDGTNNLYSTASYPSVALTVGTFMVSNGTNWVASSALTDGQIFIGSTGLAAVASTLTAGSGVSILSAAGSITISATGTGGTVTSISQGTGITLTPNPIVGAGSVELTIPVAVTSGGTGLISFNINDMIYASAANTLAAIASANSAVLRTTSAGVPGWSSPMTNGQLLIGSTGATPVTATLTGGTGVTISNTAGGITISAAASGLAWSTIAGTTQAAAVDSGYVASNAAATTITLPATAPLGSVVEIQGLGAAGWILTANAGQTIKIGTTTTSSGGTLTSAAASDNVSVVAIVANTTWRVQWTNSTGLTPA